MKRDLKLSDFELTYSAEDGATVTVTQPRKWLPAKRRSLVKLCFFSGDLNWFFEESGEKIPIYITEAAIRVYEVKRNERLCNIKLFPVKLNCAVSRHESRLMVT